MLKYCNTILISLCSLIVYAQSLDQSIYYQKQNVTISEILSDLENQYGIRFSYATSNWESEKMNVSFQGESIQDVLDYLLEDQTMEYKIVEDNILLRKAQNFSQPDNYKYQSSLHIRGQVVTHTGDGQYLPFAIIAIPNTSIGTYADEDGTFDLEIPAEYLDKELMVSYIGFEKVFYKISELHDTYLMIPLTESVQYLEKVTVVNRDKPILLKSYYNSVVLSSDLLSGTTSNLILGDINNTIKFLPGICSVNDDNSDILIRGSNSDQTLSVLDGMPIYSKGHYYGIFSPVNGDYVQSVNVYKNTYPLQYSGGASGLVEYRSKTSIGDSSHAKIGLDLLTVNGIAEIALTNKLGFKIGGRSTLKSISNNQFNTVTDNSENLQQIQLFGGKIKRKRSEPKFNFYDVNMGLVWKGNNCNSFEINGFQNKDNFINLYKTNIEDKNQNKVGLNIEENQKWSSKAGSIIWRHGFINNLILESKGYYTQYDNRESNSISLDKKYKNGVIPPNINNPNGTLLSNIHDNNLEDFGLDVHLTHIKKIQAFTFGLSGQNQSVNYSFIENKQPNIRGKESYNVLSSYGQYVLNNNKFLLSTGIRASYYNHLNEVFLSPRVNLNFSINNQWSLKSSYSIQQQVLRQFYYEYRGVPKEFWVASNGKQIPVIHSQNIMAGVSWGAKKLSLDVEVFQKYQNGLTEYAVLNPDDAANNPEMARDYQLFQGDGMIRGIDFIIHSGLKNYSTYLAYTLSWNNERYRQIYRNNYYPSENDRRHQLQWVNSYQTGQWKFGVNLTYASGRPYTDIGSVGVIADIRELDPSTWLNRLPDYKRVDIDAGYNFRIGGVNLTATASIFNLFNNQNVKYIQSVVTEFTANQNTVNTVLGNDSALLNRTYNIGLKLDI